MLLTDLFKTAYVLRSPNQLQDSSMELVQVKLSVHKLLLSSLGIQDLGQYATPPFESCT